MIDVTVQIQALVVHALAIVPSSFKRPLNKANSKLIVTVSIVVIHCQIQIIQMLTSDAVLFPKSYFDKDLKYFFMIRKRLKFLMTIKIFYFNIRLRNAILIFLGYLLDKPSNHP